MASQQEIITAVVIPSKDKERSEQQSLCWLADVTGLGRSSLSGPRETAGSSAAHSSPELGIEPSLWSHTQLLIPLKGVLLNVGLGSRSKFIPCLPRNHVSSLITENKTLKMLGHQCIMLYPCSTMQGCRTTTISILLGLSLTICAIWSGVLFMSCSAMSLSTLKQGLNTARPTTPIRPEDKDKVQNVTWLKKHRAGGA